MTGRLSRRFLLVAPLVLLSACAGTEDAATTEAAEKASEAEPITQQQIDDAVQGFVAALRNGDPAQAPNFYAADAVFVSARGKIETSDAITAFWTEATRGGAGRSLELHPLKSGTSGDLAWSISHYTGGITAPTGHVLAIMQRQPDGSLKTVAQVSIPEPAK